MNAHGITELIATLSAQGASGRLDISAGGNEGAVLLRGGKLVAARIGHLTGFQAINAVASMRDARFQFDPTFPVPLVSSITPSERLVLKQFFGIDAADSREQTAAEPLEETTIIKSGVSSEVISYSAGPMISDPAETVAVHRAPFRARYLAVAALGVLLIAIVASAVLLREKFRERSAPVAVAERTESTTDPAPAQSPVSVATKTEPVPAPEQPRVADEPRVNENPRADEKPHVDEPKETPRIAKPKETQRGSTPDLSGDWKVVNTVANSSYRSFQNLRIGFALSINQTGSTFTAKGQKVSENGRSLPANSRTPIEMKGVINGDRIEATFYEQGSKRKTNGRFVWKIDRTRGALTGTFDSSAARTSGKSTATREL